MIGVLAIVLYLLFASRVHAVHLYVSSYSGGTWAGNVTTLSLTRSGGGYTLSQVPGGSVNTSANSPSWMTYNSEANILYLLDEAYNLTTNGTVISYRTSPSGILTELVRTNALIGGAASTLYAKGQALAVAHYFGNALQTYTLGEDGCIEPLERFHFDSPDFQTGPIAARQEAPHPHQAILDPTGRFILVPDLGADLVRIFRIDQKTNKLTPHEPIKAYPGYGPRHGAFAALPTGQQVFYLVGELVGKVTAYEIEYGDYETPRFTNVSTYLTLSDYTTPENRDGSFGIAPAEIAVTPDGTLVISNRNDNTFGPDPPTDSLSSFKISREDVTLEALPPVSAHGSFPRHFAINRAGDLLAVGLQQSGTVSILARNEGSGLYDQEVAKFELPVGANIPTCIVWDE